MARTRRAATPAAPGERRRRAVREGTLRSAAEEFFARFEALVAEDETLREALAAAQQENQHLRAELAEGVAAFRRAEAAVSDAQRAPRRPRSRVVATTPGEAPPGRSVGIGRAHRPSTSSRVHMHRVTPANVTAELVRTVIESRGSATAAEIAEEIRTAGTPVSGRAIRHIAKTAGAVARAGTDGRTVYSLT